MSSKTVCAVIIVLIHLLNLLGTGFTNKLRNEIAPYNHTTGEKTLFIGGIFPMTGGWAGGKGCRPAVDMALRDVNTRPDILPGFKLEMVANDSEVS